MLLLITKIEQQERGITLWTIFSPYEDGCRKIPSYRTGKPESTGKGVRQDSPIAKTKHSD
jgi:hypothetical protein